MSYGARSTLEDDLADAELLTAGKIAQALKVTDAKVKKAIAELKLRPTAKKGVCNYYSKDTLPKIKKALG